MADFEQQLNEKLKAARKRVRQGREVKILKKSAPLLFEIMDTEISLSVNRMTGTKPLSHEDYLAEYGKVVGIRQVRSLLESKEVEEKAASDEALALDKQIKQFKDDKKANGK